MGLEEHFNIPRAPRFLHLTASLRKGVTTIESRGTRYTFAAGMWVHGTGPTRGTLDPWPFHQDAMTLRCEGRRLTVTFTDEEAMQGALARAPWVTITMHLRPV